MCLAPGKLPTTVQQRDSSTPEPVQLSSSQNNLLTHHLWQCLASFMVITGKIRDGKGSVLFMAHLQAQPSRVPMNILFCVHIENMGLSLSTIVTHPSKHKNVVGWSKL